LIVGLIRPSGAVGSAAVRPGGISAG